MWDQGLWDLRKFCKYFGSPFFLGYEGKADSPAQQWRESTALYRVCIVLPVTDMSYMNILTALKACNYSMLGGAITMGFAELLKTPQSHGSAWHGALQKRAQKQRATAAVTKK